MRTLPLVERVYRADTTVGDKRAALVRQDVAHGIHPGQGDLPTAASSA